MINNLRLKVALWVLTTIVPKQSIMHNICFSDGKFYAKTGIITSGSCEISAKRGESLTYTGKRGHIQ